MHDYCSTTCTDPNFCPFVDCPIQKRIGKKHHNKTWIRKCQGTVSVCMAILYCSMRLGCAYIYLKLKVFSCHDICTFNL